MNRSNDRSFERANIIALWHCGGDTVALLLLLLLPGRYGYGYRTAIRGTTHPPQGRAGQGCIPAVRLRLCSQSGTAMELHCAAHTSSSRAA
jgi:hypothetical protein